MAFPDKINSFYVKQEGVKLLSHTTIFNSFIIRSLQLYNNNNDTISIFFSILISLKVKKYKKTSRATSALDTSVVLESVLI